MIQEYNNVEQWKYVPSKVNPADDTSRGMNFKNSLIFKVDSRVQNSGGSHNHHGRYSVPVLLQQEDPELKTPVKTNKSAVEDDLLENIEEKYSCWLNIKRIIALVLKWEYSTEQKKEMIPTRSKKVLHFSINNLKLLDVKLLRETEKCIVKMVQLKYFNEELKLLKMKNEENVKISGKISSLKPYLDENGIIRVGWRLEKTEINNDCKHPILMQKYCHISKLIILWCRQKTGHYGRGMVLNKIRSSGFWIANTNPLTHFLIIIV